MLLLLPAGATFAEDRQPDDVGALPEVHVLPCEGSCANSTRAKAISSPQAHYPTNDLQDYVEAFAQVRYTVGIDGHVRDVVVVHLVGPPEFAESAKAATMRRQFEPAMLEGHPVEQSLILNRVFWLRGTAARAEVVQAYRTAISLINEGKSDEAAAGLTKVNSETKLNFYERGMIANILAILALQKGEYREVRDLVDVPLYFADHLPPTVVQNLLRNRIRPLWLSEI
jgi:hypothetical protein